MRLTRAGILPGVLYVGRKRESNGQGREHHTGLRFWTSWCKMADLIKWDTETRKHEDKLWALTVRTGISWRLHNALTALSVIAPDLRPLLQDSLYEMLGSASTQQQITETIMPNIPEVMHREVICNRRVYHLVAIWMVVIQGKTGRKSPAYMGEYRFVVCLVEDLEGLLDTTFRTEITIEPQAS